MVLLKLFILVLALHDARRLDLGKARAILNAAEPPPPPPPAPVPETIDERLTREQNRRAADHREAEADAKRARLLAMEAISIEHTELVMLTGDCDSSVSLTPAALKALGWERGVGVQYNRDSDAPDAAMTFIKGDHCVAVFSGTNEATDKMQVLFGLENPVDMCGFKVHAGVAQEMTSLLKSPEYSDFVEFLNHERCKRVTAAGHSLGGALATLWATCANLGANPTTSRDRSDYALVTFAPLAIATEAMYNGKPGVPFSGMRYSLTEADGGASAQRGFHVDDRAIAEEAFQIYIKTFRAKLKKALELPGQVATEKMRVRKKKPSRFAMFVLAEARKRTPVGKAIREQTAQFAASGVLSYEYDGVSSLGGFYGFKHALQDFQPLPNKLVGAHPGASMAKVPAALASDLPKADLFQFLFSVLADGRFPNHATCCYSAQTNAWCAQQYDKPESRSCVKSKLLTHPIEGTSFSQVDASAKDYASSAAAREKETVKNTNEVVAATEVAATAHEAQEIAKVPLDNKQFHLLSQEEQQAANAEGAAARAAGKEKNK